MHDTNSDMNYSRNTAAQPSAGIARPLPLQVGSFTFNIATEFINNTGCPDHSLISNITVNNVTIALNATVITCTEVATGIKEMVTINILNMNDLQLGI